MSKTHPKVNDVESLAVQQQETGSTDHSEKLKDMSQLDPFRPAADAIAQLYAPYTEVVLHSLATQTVVHITNNLSQREIGDDAALEGIDFDANENVIGPYEKLGWDGRKVRSISAVLRNATGEPIGLMCINFHLAALDQAKQALDLLVSSTALQSKPEKLFRDDWQDRVNVFLNHWLQEHKVTLSTLTREQKRELVAALFAEGAFNGKSAANYIAKVLSLGRATIFNYLKELRGEE